MNKIIAFLLVSLSFGSLSVKAQDDTIGFWQVQYKGKEISSVNLNNETSYILPALNDSSALHVFYYTESPCAKCLCKLELRDENGYVLKTIERKGYGDNRPFLIEAKDLTAWLNKGRVYMYFSGKYDGWMPWVFMGGLRKSAGSGQ